MGASPPAGLSLVVMENPRPCAPFTRFVVSLLPILRVLLCSITAWVRHDSEMEGVLCVWAALQLPPPAKEETNSASERLARGQQRRLRENQSPVPSGRLLGRVIHGSSGGVFPVRQKQDEDHKRRSWSTEDHKPGPLPKKAPKRRVGQRWRTRPLTSILRFARRTLCALPHDKKPQVGVPHRVLEDLLRSVQRKHNLIRPHQ